MRKALKQELEMRRLSGEFSKLLSMVDCGLENYRKDFGGEEDGYEEREVVETFVRVGSKKLKWVKDALNLFEQSSKDFTEYYMNLQKEDCVLVKVPSHFFGDESFLRVRKS